jgi:phosphoserine phosphatase RsbU/P
VGWLERLFLISLAALGVLQLTNDFGRAKIVALVAVVLFGIVALARLATLALRQAIWHIRDRLIVSYVFIAVVPILLLAIFAETGAWVLSSQIGAYLLKAEMDRRVGSLQKHGRGAGARAVG